MKSMPPKTVQLAELNVQDQPKIEWPSNLVVAKAYIDQLSRSQALSAHQIADLQKSIEAAEASHMNSKSLSKLKKKAPSLQKSASAAKDPADAKRLQSLANVLEHLSPTA